MLPQPSLLAGIQTWWRDHLESEAPTLYPGMHVDTSSLDAWYELWIDSWTRPPRRGGNTDTQHVAVTVHVFAKAGSDLARIHGLADAATAALQHQSIPLHDPTVSEAPLVGYAHLHEAQIQNLTRPLQPHAGDHLHHLVLTIEGLAQESSSV